MAVFTVDSSFAFKSRGVFVLAGEVTDGVIRAGMDIVFLDGAPSLKVQSIELARYSGRRPQAESALLIRYSSEEQLEELIELDLKGVALTVL